MDRSVLERKQLTELKDIASHLQMRGYQRLKKAELIDAIVKTANGGGVAPPGVLARRGDDRVQAAPADGDGQAAPAAEDEREAAPRAEDEREAVSHAGDDDSGRARVRTRTRERERSDEREAHLDGVVRGDVDGAAPADAEPLSSAERTNGRSARPGADERERGGAGGDGASADNGGGSSDDGSSGERGGGTRLDERSERSADRGSEQTAERSSERTDGRVERSDEPAREHRRPADGQPSRDSRDDGQGRDDDPNRRRRRNRRERKRGKGPGQPQAQAARQGRPQDDDSTAEPGEVRTGVLDVLPEGYGFLRTTGYMPGDKDVYVSQGQVRKHGLRRGDVIEGPIRAQRPSDKVPALHHVDTVNGNPLDDSGQLPHRPDFKDMTPLFPAERLRLETPDGPISMRIIDLLSPIGKGQRGLIVSPPKAGKTTILKEIGQAIAFNNPECHVMVVLVDERPEEVTDMSRSVPGEIIASTFDRPADDHTQIAELAIERAKRLVEQGEDVVILLDNITRLARAYNLSAPASGRIMSGGVDSTALYPPKRFFGAARNIEGGGSLTIIAAALIETGSKMDEVIFEEFKGTGNMELRLDRRLEQKRIFPAIEIGASGTRKEELLLDKEELLIIWKLRRVLHALEGPAALELLIDKMKSTRSNNQFLVQIQKSNLQA
ncbi:MAG TPA: transcription termination factor Rho [Egibacteraceae bacterium]|nr:transcription termination factor Rho [Egibacteraceae bacterium]